MLANDGGWYAGGRCLSCKSGCFPWGIMLGLFLFGNNEGGRVCGAVWIGNHVLKLLHGQGRGKTSASGSLPSPVGGVPGGRARRRDVVYVCLMYMWYTYL